VNDPLSIAGYTFHQNGFGPAPNLLVRDDQGRPLWDGAVPLTDAAAGSPYGIVSVPGRDLGLQLLLRREADGTGVVLILPYRVVGTNPDGSPIPQNFTPLALASGETGVARDVGLSIELRGVDEYTLLIAKRDPGQGIVWLAFACLIAGITITFYLPRRRVWTRLDPAGRLAVVWRSDRYVDVDREFGRLLDQLVAARRPG
jgi:cytochrome c biogenesis protein ResB